MKYRVEKFNKEKRQWELDSEHLISRSARDRCLEIVGHDFYSEPLSITEYVTPEYEGYQWNGFTYMNKEGKTKGGYTKEIFYMSQGYFSSRGNDVWDCRITI